MNKSKILLTLLLIFWNAHLGLAIITYEFNVLAVNGAVEYKVKGTDDWQRIKVGDILDTIHIIRIGKNSYLGLVHKTGYTLELTQNKLYEVKSLIRKQSTKSSISLNRILSYLSNYFDNSPRGNNYRSNMKNAATVERSLNFVNVNEYPKSTRFASPKTTFFWDNSKRNELKFTIFDEDNQILFDTLVRGSKIDIDLSKLKINENRVYFWTIEPKNSPNAETKKNTFILIDKEQQNQIKNELAELSKNLNLKSPLDNFILAGFYDYYELFYDSYNILKKIKQLAPNNSFYSQYFEDWCLTKIK